MYKGPYVYFAIRTYILYTYIFVVYICGSYVYIATCIFLFTLPIFILKDAWRSMKIYIFLFVLVVRNANARKWNVALLQIWKTCKSMDYTPRGQNTVAKQYRTQRGALNCSARLLAHSLSIIALISLTLVSNRNSQYRPLNKFFKRKRTWKIK